MKKIGFGLMVVALGLGFVGPVRAPLVHAQDSEADDHSSERRDPILTIDRFVPHISTALANQGERVPLFVREKVRRGHPHQRGTVLLVAGATTPVIPSLDLQFRNYSWMTFLAEAGFDVFAMDLQGYGFSARPRMDDPCNTQPSQQSLLVPFPLAKPCHPSYPYKMAIQSDWDEIDRVVDYIRQHRGVEKVSLAVVAGRTSHGWLRRAASRESRQVSPVFPGHV